MNLQGVVSLSYAGLFVMVLVFLYANRSHETWPHRRLRGYLFAVLVTLSYPVVILLLTFVHQLRSGETLLRISHYGYRVSMSGAEPTSKRITFGGHRREEDLSRGESVDHVFINRLPGNFLTVTAAAEGFRVEIRAADGAGGASGDPVPPDPRAVLEVNGVPRNAHPLDGDARIHVTLADGQEVELTLAPGAPLRSPAVVTADGRRAELATTRPRVPFVGWRLPLRRPFAAGERIYRLADVLEEMGYPVVDAGIESFLFARRDLAWFDFSIVLADLATRVETDSGPVAAARSFVVEKIDDLGFHRVERDRVGRRRLVRLTGVGPVTLGGNAFEVAFSRPRHATLRHRRSPSAKTAIYLAGFEPPPGLEAARVLGNSQIYEPASAYLRLPPLAFTAELRRELAGRPAVIEVTEGHRQRRVESGQRFLLGSDHAIETSIEQVALPGKLIAWVVAAAVVQLLLLRAALPSAQITALLATTNLFLGLRLLFGLKAALFPPASEEALRLALHALILVPVVLIACVELRRVLLGHGPRERQAAREHVWLLAGFSILVGALVLPALGAATWLVLGAVLPLAPALAFESANLLLDPRYGGRPAVVRFVRWARDPRSFRQVMLAGLVLFGVRLLLLPLGFREAVYVGGRRLAFEMIYSPALAVVVGLALGLLLLHFQRASYLRAAPPEMRPGEFLRRRTPLRLAALFCLLAVVSVTVAVLVSDLGMVVPGALGLLGVTAGGCLVLFRAGWRQSPRPWVLLAASGLGVASFAAAVLSPWLLLAGLRWISDDPASLDRNLLRVHARFAPQEVATLGTREAQELLVENTRLAAYAAMEDPRYLGAPMLSIRPQDLFDHVAAVYLLAEFGFAGGLLLLLALAALAALPFWYEARGRPQPGTRIQAPQTVALACLLSVSFTGVFMLAANLGALPLIGKNINLLSLNSASDVVTSLGLLGIAVVAMDAQRWIDRRV